MKTGLYLSLLVLVALLGVVGLTDQGQGASVVRQTWDYKIIARSRDPFKVPFDWNNWSEDAKALSTPVDILAKTKQLGEGGWELVSVTPRSSNAGAAGVTTEELWVFKRPKP